LGESSTFVGARWVYVDLATSLDVAAGDAGLAPKDLARRNSGLGVVVEHDSRDNVFTPNRGWIGAAEATFYDPDFGGANRFQSYRGHVFAYWPASDRLTAALRVDGRAARGDVPFYFLPFLDMRGVPAARYQDENTAVVEAEVRYEVTPRWSVVGFLGAGRAWGRGTSFDDTGSIVNKGVGVRYLVARRLGLYVGIDVARGPEDTAFYLQVGNGWR
jgi:outer membrane protein assembly factor BamA